MLLLRLAEVSDAFALAELRAASLLEMNMLAVDAVAAFTPRAARDFAFLLRADRLCAWVACSDDSLVASSCALFYDRLPYADGSLHAELCGVYVKPAYRNRGLASELVREVIGSSRSWGARKMFLRPAMNAKSLYSRLGFVQTEQFLLREPSEPANPSGQQALSAWPSR